MITQATSKDVKKLWHLEQEIFDIHNFPLSLASFYYHIKRNKVFLYRIENQIVGYCLWLKSKHSMRLYSIGVSPHFRSQGVAKKLLEYSLVHLDTPCLTLEVRCNNHQAIALYERYDFKIMKLLKGYYPNGIDGYKMLKKNAITS
jgi:ribosomal-protein-alanine N-acetyltransferase